MSDQSRHEQLLAAHWRYDPLTDRYTAPGSAADGTARQYDIGSAWYKFQADEVDAAHQQHAPKQGARQADPRRKEPE
jgi:hypothetical protein